MSSTARGGISQHLIAQAEFASRGVTMTDVDFQGLRELSEQLLRFDYVQGEGRRQRASVAMALAYEVYRAIGGTDLPSSTMLNNLLKPGLLIMPMFTHGMTGKSDMFLHGISISRPGGPQGVLTDSKISISRISEGRMHIDAE